MSLIACQRALFDIPDEVAYLDCAKMSPMLNAASEAGRRGLERKAHPWKVKSAHFFDESEQVRGLYARLIGAGADDVAIVPSVSYGMATAMKNVRVSAGQSIVTLGEDFPSGVYAARALAQEAEADIVVVAKPEQASDWTAALLDAIDGDTALVVAPHVHWMHGVVIDLEAVARRCRSVGAALVLDTTQSMGAYPLDFASVDPDYMVAASYKWLLGPYSLGFLYVAPRHQGGAPLEEGWMTRAGAEDFRRLTGYPDALQPNARRFDMGERANFALLPVAGAAIEQLLEWQPERIAETLGATTARLEAQLAPLGITAEAGRAPHFLPVRFEGGMPEDVESRLAAANVHVSLRGETMRITPHLYNNVADEERLVAALAGARG
ncbi:MAG TPA: aminotransferase class V-fold PLP-dependent enzyme [Allosphingosinicella sp.]